MVEKFFKAAIKHNANDIHLSLGVPPLFRVGGEMVRLKTDALTENDIDLILRTLTPPRCMVELSKTGNTDYVYNFEGHRFRVAVFRQCGTLGMVMRHFRNVIFSLDELDIPLEVSTAIVQERGLFLITGPTGSGKTTTMASLVDHINTSTCKHIITIEDPVEILHTHKNSIVSQREIGVDVNSFTEGLRWSMRQDPDVIVIGEIRDVETSRIVLTAADTGHLVFGTMHSRTAPAAITRIIAAFPHDEQPFVRLQLSSALLGIINQVLLPIREGDGMTSVVEILMNSHTVASLIRQEKEQHIADEIRKGRRLGMVSFEESLHHRCVNREIDWQVAVKHSRDPEAFKNRMEKK
ncbi:MAG: PilT/PilU family type 4a pilus ATPase [Desulfobulbaceae bacterium]|nr:PilT/PilU family type 4a pilus ATPase [Desulfobulbaceae bacterium]